MNYGLAIDAGSTGSRIHVYEWCAREYDPQRPVLGPVTVPDLVAAKDVRPGIGDASFQADPNKLCAYLVPLLNFARDVLVRKRDAKESLRDIPIFLKATAGMRETPQVKRDAVMLNVRLCLSDKSVSPFKFEWRYASVISGDEEGSFAWLHVNAMLGNLFSSVPKTVGVIDMGGASVQVVFVPEHDVLEDYFPVSHGAGRRLGLYSKSYETFGWHRAIERMRAVKGHHHHHHHPCFPTEKDDGVFDLRACATVARSLFASEAECYIPTCTFNGVYQPRLFDTPFVAINGLAHAAAELGLLERDVIGTVSMKRWWNALERCCHGYTLKEIQRSRPHNDIPRHFDDHVTCAVATYVHSFLTQGLGFRSESEQISFRVELDGTEPTVSYGLMLHEIQYMPWAAPKTYGAECVVTTGIALLMTIVAVGARVMV
eukprot:g1687.t1